MYMCCDYALFMVKINICLWIENIYKSPITPPVTAERRTRLSPDEEDLQDGGAGNNPSYAIVLPKEWAKKIYR